eukprot:GEZU01021573.1.p1 GENE.GEZU01021573.1~~GEZU01021573.1.p1  ORF type:complete len:224 (+),score=23.83 GEZU01021573.1:126-797(+)
MSVASTALYDSGAHGVSPLLQAAFAHGLTILIVVHIFGPISGGHVNPAVTFACMITRNISIPMGLFYWIAQLSGAVIGSLLMWMVLPEARSQGVFGEFYVQHISVWRGFAVESILTFLLVLVVFGAGVKPQHIGQESDHKELSGFLSNVIGLALAASVLSGGELTGGCLNPARAFGPQIVVWRWDHSSWVYYTAPFLGAGIAGLLFEFVLTKPRPAESYWRVK